jgi:hypothetical protein
VRQVTAESELATPIGRVVATELKPSTSHLFHFWTSPEAPVGIGAIVRVEGEGRMAWGVVTEGQAYSDLVRPLDAVAEPTRGPAPGQRPPRPEIRLYTAAVLRHHPEEPVKPVALGSVFAATNQDVITALRMDGYLGHERATGIPFGLYAGGGSEAPVYLDADFLLGPEAAHLNITGVSGLATKTSAVSFLISAIFQRLPAHKGRVAALCFNVKGPDLCFMDQPASLGEADLAIYDRLGLVPEPFTRMRLYAPPRADGVNLNTLRSHPQLADRTEPLVWGLREVLDFAEVLLNRDDIDAKADAFVDFLAERVVGREYQDSSLGREPFRVRSFADLERFFRAIFDHLEAQPRGAEVWRTHHVATIRKIRNRLGNISTRSKGLVTEDGTANDLPWQHFQDRTLYVVDVAGVDPLAQDLVFARVVSKLREHLERRDLGVEQVVVFVDELNKFAPADGPETYVRQMLLDLSERGRYLGLTLFSAQQFRSQVHRRVVGNAGTAVFGRMDGDELSAPAYGTLTPAVKARLAALPKGELMVRHPHFTHPVFVRFPRPAALTGREGVERFPPAPDLPFEQAVARRLRVLDPAIPAAVVVERVAGRRESDVREALHRTIRERPDDALAYFTACLGRAVPLETPGPRRGMPGVPDLPDPYA